MVKQRTQYWNAGESGLMGSYQELLLLDYQRALWYRQPRGGSVNIVILGLGVVADALRSLGRGIEGTLPRPPRFEWAVASPTGSQYKNTRP